MRLACCPALPSTALTSGQLDTTFGIGGKITLDFGGTVARATAVAIQPDGKIVVVGQAQTSSTLAARLSVVRVTSGGLLDPTFGVGGKVHTDFFGGEDRANAVALQSDGKILVGGYAVGAGVGP